MQVGGRSFRKTKWKYRFHKSHHYSVDLLTSEYQENQRSKWLKNVIDNFFEQRPVLTINTDPLIAGSFHQTEEHSLLALFLTIFSLSICCWPLWDTVLDQSLA